MKFLVDAQLPPALARWISSRGHEGLHVADLKMEGAKDERIAGFAKQENAILITKDEDFVNRSHLWSLDLQIVWIRKGNCSKVTLISWFSHWWPQLSARLQAGERIVELRP